MSPARVQLSRQRGARLPPNTKVVSRPGLFGNPWKVTETLTKAEAVAAHRAWLEGAQIASLPPADWGEPLGRRRALVLEALPSLLDRSLACWCKLDVPCHADTLLELAKPKAED
jgi:hypothetical protein